MLETINDQVVTDIISDQLRFAQGLTHCSQALLIQADGEEEKINVLNTALEYLRQATESSRAFLYRNVEDPELGFCSEAVSVACDHNYPADSTTSRLLRKIPWSIAPDKAQYTLEAGQPFGGIVDELFATKPDFLRVVKEDGVLSLQFFPIRLEGHWWGYIGFDERRQVRQWTETEITLLGTAAEMFANTLHRWQTEAALKLQSRHEEALSSCSRALLQVVYSEEEQVAVLNQGLEYLRSAVDAGRAYLLRNFVDPELGLCAGILAEVCAPGVFPQIGVPINQRFPWSKLPAEMRQALEAGNAFGGPVNQSFASNPQMVQDFKQQRNPLLSLQTFPIHFGDRWWGLIGFDDVEKPRRWSSEEIRILRIASEMIGNTLHRWQAQEALHQARDQLEIRVAERTSELVNRNKQLRQEIANRLQAEAEVNQRLSVERTLADVSTRLVKATDPRAILPDVLGDVARMVDARRVALIFLKKGGESVDDIYEWHSPHRPPLEPTLLSDLMPAFAWMRQQLEESHPVVLENLNHIPTSAAAEKKIVHDMGAESIALFPLHVDGVLAAVLVCSNFAKKETKVSRQFDILNVVSDLLGTLLQREALLDSLEQRAIDRTRELAAFYDMTMLAAEVENLSDILEPALNHIMVLARCQAVSIHELSADGACLRLLAQHGLGHEKRVQVEMPSDGFFNWFDSLSEPIIENRLAESERLPLALRPEGFEIYLGAQLRARGKALGILSCYRQIDRPYSLNITALVVALAEQLGIIIENYRLQRQAEQGVIIEERQRLARDLHDAITQSLYGVTLFARSSADALEEGSFEKAIETLQEVEQNALDALKEMRLLLHQLQPLALEQGGLRQAIDDRLNQVERRLGIEATLAITEGLILLPRAKEFVYRIITEALNNSLKHADATAVSVRLYEIQGLIRLEVHDNGRGFDPANPISGMGIKNMHERAAMLRGELILSSAPEDGTTVRLDLPVEWLE